MIRNGLAHWAKINNHFKPSDEAYLFNISGRALKKVLHYPEQGKRAGRPYERVVYAEFNFHYHDPILPSDP